MKLLEREEKMLAFCCGNHARLGENSLVRLLDCNVLSILFDVF